MHIQIHIHTYIYTYTYIYIYWERCPPFIFLCAGLCARGHHLEHVRRRHVHHGLAPRLEGLQRAQPLQRRLAQGLAHRGGHHQQTGTHQLGLYKIFFYFKAFVHESIHLLLPSPTCITHTIATLLHDHCAQCYPPLTALLYAIHHTLLRMEISCKG